YVAFDKLLVTGKHHVAGTAFATKAWLIHPVERDADLAAFQDILDGAVLGGFLGCTLNQRLGATQETLAVLEALAARIQTPIDDEHGPACIRLLSRLVSPSCTIRRAGEPDARYNRARPSARQIRRASFRSRRPFWSRTRSPEEDPRLGRISASRSPRESFHSWSRTGSCRCSGHATAART